MCQIAVLVENDMFTVDHFAINTLLNPVSIAGNCCSDSRGDTFGLALASWVSGASLIVIQFKIFKNFGTSQNSWRSPTQLRFQHLQEAEYDKVMRHIWTQTMDRGKNWKPNLEASGSNWRTCERNFKKQRAIFFFSDYLNNLTACVQGCNFCKLRILWQRQSLKDKNHEVKMIISNNVNIFSINYEPHLINPSDLIYNGKYSRWPHTFEQWWVYFSYIWVHLFRLHLHSGSARLHYSLKKIIQNAFNANKVRVKILTLTLS